MAEESHLERAKAKALRLVAARPRTAREIRDRLARAGFEAESEAVAGWLERLGYLDDEGYARQRAERLLSRGGIGPQLAEARLAEAGVPVPLARRAVAEALAAEPPGAQAGSPEAERCRLVAARRAGRPLAELALGERSRLARLLLRRGFSPEAVSEALGVHVDDEGGR